MTQRHHHPTTQTTDTECASYLFAVGQLRLLRIDASGPRALYVFSDPRAQGAALRAAYVADPWVKHVLRARKQLTRGVALARAAPGRCLTGAELSAHYSAMDAARRGPGAPGSCGE